MYDRCGKIDSRFAQDAELELCYDKLYIDKLRKTKSQTEAQLKRLSNNNKSVYFNADTFDCARLATGCLLSVIDNVCLNKVRNSMTLWFDLYQTLFLFLFISLLRHI